MPLPNRVRPDGSLFADPARGLFFGNRGGRFHDPKTRELPSRIQAGKAWLCCVLSFKGRHHAVWGSGYTDLFFCDEVTALAAGHRPCMECRRNDAIAYREAMVRGLGLGLPQIPLFPEIDLRLDRERRDGRAKRTHRWPAEALPDGAMILAPQGTGFLALRGRHALPWTPSGYGAPLPRPCGDAIVFTPPATLAALAHGYLPVWHASAN